MEAGQAEPFCMEDEERLDLERQLRESEQRYRDLLDDVPAVVYTHDFEGNFTSLNRAGERLSGYTREEAARLNIREILAPEYLELAMQMIRAKLAGSQGSLYEVEIITKDRRRVRLELTTRIRYQEEKPHCVLGIAHDITERKRAEEALRASEQRFRIAAEQSSDLIYEWDARTGRIEYHTPIERLYERTVRQPPESVEDWARRIYHEDQERVIAASRRELEMGEPFNEEYRFLASDGTWRHFSHRAIPILDQSGRVSRTIGLITDITQKKHAEQEREKLQAQLTQAQRLEAVGRLAGGIAHDFNNLLTVINGYSALILNKLHERDPIQHGVLEIKKAGERAAALTQQLLAFSRRQILQPKVLNLNAVVSGIETMMRRLVGEDVSLTTQLDPALGFVTADAGQLEQVLMNLVVNARDAMPDGGRLVIKTSNVEVDQAFAGQHPEARTGPHVLLSVSDTGKGMSEEDKARIFEPFFTTKKEGEGTGLGLSTVYGIMKQSGGWVSVSSKANNGSTFQVYLPRIEGSPGEAPTQKAVEVDPRGTETILVVEDQEDVRRLTCEILAGFGYKVIEAGSGDEALELCGQTDAVISLVLTDVVMPGMSGPELVDKLAALRRPIKVLYASGYTESVIVHHGVEKPGLAYIAKPFTPDGLGAKVREVLDSGSPGTKILVVDDEASVRALMREVLTQAGYEVIEASNGREAMKALRSQTVPLVITDLVMPEQEGIETITELRRRHPEAKIIAVSGAFHGKFLRAAEMLGADLTLMKPVEPAELLGAVRKVLAV